MLAEVRFRIVTRWQLRGRREDVARLLSEPEGFVRWWGDVCLGVSKVQAGDARGIGRVVAVHSKGWLPYRLNWQGRLGGGGGGG